MLRRVTTAAAHAFLIAIPLRGVTAQGVDVIRGQVTGPARAPIENVSVTATSVSGGVNRMARTDRNGRYTITFAGGEGDYFVRFLAIGYVPRAVEVKRITEQEILVADAQLERIAATLDTQRVVAGRNRVSRDADKAPDISGTEQVATNAAVASAQQGDLNAAAISLPGVSLYLGSDGDPSGFSVLGLPADANSIALNGLPFGSTTLPRDATVTTSLVTTPYDVARGGFSGGQLNIRSAAGSNFIKRGASLFLDAPPLQWTDATARALGARYAGVSFGGASAGPLVYDRAFYSISYQLGRRSYAFRSLYNTSEAGLKAAGITPASVARLDTILRGHDVPLLVNGRAPADRLSDNGSVFGSLDFTPSSSPTGQTFNLTFNGNWNRLTPAAAAVTEFPAHGADRDGLGGGLQASHSAFVKNTILSETVVGVNGNRSRTSPYAQLPSADVLVTSTFADGSVGFSTVDFGGNAFFNSRVSTGAVSASNALSWFSDNNRHRLKFATEARGDWAEQAQSANLMGTFAFNSVADLEANRPASYVRSLQPATRRGSETVGAVSLGDFWQVGTNLRVQYGLRLDGNRFATGPAFNQAVFEQFDVRNDSRPNRAYLSPRVGFVWNYGKAPQVGAPGGNLGGAAIRGGVGVFQSTPTSTLMSSAIATTGLPGGMQQLTCIGDAVPIPDWAAYAADPSNVPRQCADGTSGASFSNSAPNVILFAPNYVAPRSLRGNLQWSGPALGNRFTTLVEATYSRNEHVASAVDLNFKPTAQFTLADEANRPVFVSAMSIVPSTGAAAPGEARVSSLFNRVLEQRSDLTGETRQLRLSVAPAAPSTRLSWALSYVLMDSRQQFRGFTSTAGNPLTVESARGTVGSRHQFTYNVAYNFFDVVRATWFGRTSSGVAYTPLVQGDLNGDGNSLNDRPFIVDPNGTSDTTMARAMRELLAGGSRSARECLSAQLRTIARRNSCTGPWSSTANLDITFNSARIHLPQRAALSLSVSNPLGAADLALHGMSGLHGWGVSAAPDATFLYVRGFDRDARRFLYGVNPRFGSTNPQFAQFSQPVAVTVQLKFDVGPSREEQVLLQQLDRGRRAPGARLTEGEIKALYGSGGILNPIAPILRQATALKLSGVQADSLASMNRRYTVTLDSIWTDVAHQLADAPIKYDRGAAYGLYRRAREADVDMLMELAPAVLSLLSDEQLRQLAPGVTMYLDSRYLAGIRSGTYGNTDAGVFGGAAKAPGNEGGFVPFGGGQRPP